MITPRFMRKFILASAGSAFYFKFAGKSTPGLGIFCLVALNTDCFFYQIDCENFILMLGLALNGFAFMRSSFGDESDSVSISLFFAYLTI